MTTSGTEEVRGLSDKDDGLRIELDTTELPPGPSELSFRILNAGAPETEFEVEHERRMHLIVVRRDLTGFQHLHPRMDEGGTWTTPIVLEEGGRYRVFADFNHDGENLTLGTDLAVGGRQPAYQELPQPAAETRTESGYQVAIEGAASEAGQPSELAFHVTRDGEPVEVEPYLGADGHLVALREGDLAFLHVHPLGGGAHGGHGPHGGDAAASERGVRFMTEFPSEGRYRLFLQFKHGGRVHTAEFTREVAG